MYVYNARAVSYPSPMRIHGSKSKSQGKWRLALLRWLGYLTPNEVFHGSSNDALHT